MYDYLYSFLVLSLIRWLGFLLFLLKFDPILIGQSGDMSSLRYNAAYGTLLCNTQLASRPKLGKEDLLWSTSAKRTYLCHTWAFNLLFYFWGVVLRLSWAFQNPLVRNCFIDAYLNVSAKISADLKREPASDVKFMGM